MPMVGIVKRSVISWAKSSGMPSKTTENAPASSTASASRKTTFAALLFPALNLVAAELMHRLRRQADMAHDRNAGFDNRLDGLAHRSRRPRA